MLVNHPPTAKDPCDPSRCRTRFVEAVGRELAIPRHVRRVDGKRGLAGWQVVFEPPSRYFSDASYSGPLRSLQAACTHLREIWRPIPKITHRGRDPWLRRKTEGVRVVEKVNAKGIAQIYVETWHPQRKGGVRRFYAGTARTSTPARVLQARKQALAQRQAWLDASPVPTR